MPHRQYRGAAVGTLFVGAQREPHTVHGTPTVVPPDSQEWSPGPVRQPRPTAGRRNA